LPASLVPKSDRVSSRRLRGIPSTVITEVVASGLLPQSRQEQLLIDTSGRSRPVSPRPSFHPSFHVPHPRPPFHPSPAHSGTIAQHTKRRLVTTITIHTDAHHSTVITHSASDIITHLRYSSPPPRILRPAISPKISSIRERNNPNSPSSHPLTPTQRQSRCHRAGWSITTSRSGGSHPALTLSSSI
jgi:hypothetical protein